MTAREVTATVTAGGRQASYSVTNLSVGGALVTGGHPPPKGALLDIELRLQGAARASALKGRVVNVRAEGIGIAFEEMTSTEGAAMEKLISAVDARNVLPPPLPPTRTRSNDELPPVAPRPDDAFFEGQDPRPPRSGSPDERADYLRALLKSREDAIRRGRAALAAVVAEADALRTLDGRLREKLAAAAAQQAVTELALAASRQETEREREARLAERATSADLLEQEQRRTLEAIATVSSVEATVRRKEMEAVHAREEAEHAIRQANSVEASGTRKVREELFDANKRAMEAQAVLKKERADRLATDKALAEALATQKAAADETQQLRGELARMKAKLVAAEDTIEKMASRKRPAPVGRPAK